ncbi:MAG: ABC transporter permease [Christensenellales bacterium]|jgi:putative aldouronate transport system permease protein
MQSVPNQPKNMSGISPIIHSPRRKPALKRLFASWQLYVLLIPAFIYYGIYHYAPMYGVQIAFRDYTPTLGIAGSPWVGLKHFLRFFRSIEFFRLFRNTLLLSVYSLVFDFPFPIILALMINELRNQRYKKFVQNVTYMPHFISNVVLCGMVISFTSPSAGFINMIIQAFGGDRIDFMSNPRYFRSIYVISGVWQQTGWSSIIYIAALAGIDREMLEAAEIDGVSRMQKILYINIPCILPTIIVLLIMNSGRVMNIGFEKVFLLQNALNMEVSEVISTYVYKRGLLGAQFSFSAMVGLFNSAINLVLLVLVNKISQKVSETSLW